jgi:hypothetical protein
VALNDSALTSALAAAIETVHSSPSDASAGIGNAIKNYAAGANLTVPGATYTSPSGPATGSATATPSFTGSALDSGLATAFGSNHTRAQAANLLAQAVAAYVATGTATVPASGLVSPAGPVTGSATASPPTFDTGTLTSSIAQLFAQDNSAAFFAAGFASAIATCFKSGTFPVPALGYTAPIPAGSIGPVTGAATATVS